ncbi:MAG: hypothetical protein WC895_00460 [Candidatus Shapirobacteria bacterium]|jgi:hypothetical protein
MPLLIIISIFFSFLIKPAMAVTATPSADQTKDIVDIIQQKVKEKLNLINTPSNQPKSFFGAIIKIDQNQILISYQNKNQIINVDENTAYVDLKRNKSKFANLKIGQEILAMGYLNDDQSLNTKRIVVTELKAVDNPNQIIVGQIVDISKSSPIFVLIPSKNKDNQYQIKTDSKTEIIDIKNNKLDSKVLTSGKKIIVIISPDTKIAKTFYASKIISLETSTPKQ